MTKIFAEGIQARANGLILFDNPYKHSIREEYEEWEKGWKLENWRLRKNAERKEINRQIYID